MVYEKKELGNKTVLQSISGASLAWTSENIGRFWDHWSHLPETYFTYQFGAQIVQVVDKYLRDRTVLDYGCGAGHLTEHLLKAGFKVSGCDLSPDSVALVNGKFGSWQNFGGAKHVVDMGGSDACDAAFLVEVVEHLDDGALVETFARLSKLLNSTGIVIITTPNREDLASSTVYCPTCDHTFHRWQHVRAWSSITLREFLLRVGYDVIETIETDFSYKPPSRPPERLHKRALRRLFGLPWHVAPAGKPHLVCVARKSI